MATEATPTSAPTVAAALRTATELLRTGSQTPRLDAELLLAEVLGCGRARLITERERTLRAPEADRLQALVARRAAHEPIAYLLGRRDFRRLTLQVDRRVLIPRPETELLVDAALSLPHGASVIDVGTGSGAVALAVKDERPDLVVTGVDISSDALEVARANAQRLQLDVSLITGDLLDERRFDAVLANLPYVAVNDELIADVADYEPPEALWAGADGLTQIRRLVDSIARIAPAARPVLLALEIGCDQGAEVARMVTDAGYPRVQVHSDLAGLDRVVIGEHDRR